MAMGNPTTPSQKSLAIIGIIIAVVFLFSLNILVFRNKDISNRSNGKQVIYLVRGYERGD
jgi:hypothetical protein